MNTNTVLYLIVLLGKLTLSSHQLLFASNPSPMEFGETNHSSNGLSGTDKQILAELQGKWKGDCTQLQLEDTSDENDIKFNEKYFQFRITVENNLFKYSAIHFSDECETAVKSVDYKYELKTLPSEGEHKLYDIELSLLSASATLYSEEFSRYCTSLQEYKDDKWDMGKEKSILGKVPHQCGDLSGQTEGQTIGFKETASFYLKGNNLQYPLYTIEDLDKPEMLTNFTKETDTKPSAEQIEPDKPVNSTASQLPKSSSPVSN